MGVDETETARKGEICLKRAEGLADVASGRGRTWKSHVCGGCDHLLSGTIMSSSPTVASAVPSNKTSSPISSSPPKQIYPAPAADIQPPAASLTQNIQARPLSEIIGATFPPFDHQVNIVTPFNNELNRDVVFERGMSAEVDRNFELRRHA